MASIPSERITVGGGGNDDEQERLLPFLLFIFNYDFLFCANLLPSSTPPPLNPHNRQVDDCVMGEEEILIEGVEVEVEAEEVEEDVGVDLSAVEGGADRNNNNQPLERAEGEAVAIKKIMGGVAGILTTMPWTSSLLIRRGRMGGGGGGR